MIYNAKMKKQLWNLDLILESFPTLPDFHNSVFELICYLNGEQYTTNLGDYCPQLVQEIMEMVTIVQKEWSNVLELNYKRGEKVYYSWKRALNRSDKGIPWRRMVVLPCRFGVC